MTMLKSFLRDEQGATAIEYGLIAAGISVAIITVVGQLGSSLNTTIRQREERPELTSRSRPHRGRPRSVSGPFLFVDLHTRYA